MVPDDSAFTLPPSPSSPTPIRVLRLLEYSYDSFRRYSADVAAWAVQGQARFGSMSVRSVAFFPDLTRLCLPDTTDDATTLALARLDRAREWLARVDPSPGSNGDHFRELRDILG